jgi:hypothetical protein
MYGDGETGMTESHRLIVTSNTSRIVKVNQRSRTDSLRAAYDVHLNRQNALVIPPHVIDQAIKLISIPLEKGNFRSNILTHLMAGAMYIAMLEEKITVTEADIARAFCTKGGISQGKNRMIGHLIDAHLKDPIGHPMPDYLLKDFKTLRSYFIKQQMLLVGLSPDRKSIYHFIKCLSNIEQLFKCFDPQTLMAKIAGSIFYFLENADEPNIPVSSIVEARISTSKETYMKYVRKLSTAQANVIAIAKILKIKLKFAESRMN